MFSVSPLDVWGRVRTASDVCATSQQEYQRLGLCAETVQRRGENGRRPLMRKVLTNVFRIEIARKSAAPKREIRQNFGGFWPSPVKRFDVSMTILGVLGTNRCQMGV
jgi:hypothetical protein